MMVVNIDFAYSVIFGHLCLNKMRTVISTFHQTIKFSNEDKVETLKFEQRVARSYVETTNQRSSGSSQ